MDSSNTGLALMDPVDHEEGDTTYDSVEEGLLAVEVSSDCTDGALVSSATGYVYLHRSSPMKPTTVDREISIVWKMRNSRLSDCSSLQSQMYVTPHDWVPVATQYKALARYALAKTERVELNGGGSSKRAMSFLAIM